MRQSRSRSDWITLRPATPDDWAIADVLRERAWLLEAVLHQFPNGSINVFDRDLRYVLAGGAGLRRVGLSPASLIGQRLADLYPADSVGYVQPFYERAFAGEEVEFELAVFDRVYTLRASPLREPGGAVRAIVVIAQEVTGPAAPSGALTPRQLEVAALVAAGLSNAEIAERLVLSPGTVARHVEQILQRLGYRRRTQIVRWGVERGLTRSGGVAGA